MIRRGTREPTRATVARFAAGFTTVALIRRVQPIVPAPGREFGRDAATASLSLSVTAPSLALALRAPAGLCFSGLPATAMADVGDEMDRD